MSQDESMDERTRQQMEKIQVVQPAVVVGFNKGRELCVNVMRGTSPEQAVVMLIKMANEMAARIQYHAEDTNKIMAAAPEALKVLDGMAKRNGLG